MNSRVHLFVASVLIAIPSCDMSDADLDRRLGDGLEAYYQFNGDANDLTGHGYSGMVIGADSASNRFGKPGSAYRFTGSGTYIRLGNILDNVFCAPWQSSVSPAGLSPGTGDRVHPEEA